MAYKLNVGCGFKKLDGYKNIDIDPEVKPDIVRDLTKGFPFEDSCVEEVLAYHVLEHLSWEDFQYFMQEIWRVCKNKAIVKIQIPHYKFMGAWDIDHRIVLTPRTFQCFTNREGCASYKRFNKGAIFSIIECIDDEAGKIHSEPQFYITLEAAK